MWTKIGAVFFFFCFFLLCTVIEGLLPLRNNTSETYMVLNYSKTGMPVNFMSTFQLVFLAKEPCPLFLFVLLFVMCSKVLASQAYSYYCQSCLTACKTQHSSNGRLLVGALQTRRRIHILQHCILCALSFSICVAAIGQSHFF